MPTVVELAPFVQPCPDDEKRFADCADGATVGDLVKALAVCLKLETKDLKVVKVFEEGSKLVLHNKEAPSDKLMVKGVRSLTGVPDRLEVGGKEKPSAFTKEEAIQIQTDTMENYRSELVQLQLKALQEECIDEWKYLPKVDPVALRAYNTGLRGILQPQQAKFFPKYGFEATSKDMAIMQSIFNNMLDDKEIQDNTNMINAIIGTDFGWLPPEIQAKQVAQVEARPSAAAAMAAEEEEAPAEAKAPEVAPPVTAGNFEVETQE